MSLKTHFSLFCLIFLSGCATQGLVPAPITDLTQPDNSTIAHPNISPETKPASSVIVTPAPSLVPPNPGKGQYLVIKKDTLFSIAKKFKVTVSKLSKKNDLPPPYLIRPGDILTIEGNLPYYKVPSIYPPPTQNSTITTQDGTSQILGKPKRKGSFLEPIAIRGLLSPFGIGKGIELKSVIYQGGEGEPVYAIKDAFVSYVGDGIKGYGLLVLLEHGDGLMSAYSFLAHADIKVGSKIKQGDIIGALGQVEGFPKGSLLFQIRKAGKPVDPKNYFKNSP